jgi:tetratricopeptide (TPR) repeat protein
MGGILGVAILGTLWLPRTLDRNRLWQDDVALWKQAASLYPENARAHYNLGVAWAERGQISHAEESFERALRLNPRDSLNYAALGYCAQVERRSEEAIRLCQTALRIDPFNHYARGLLEELSDRSKASTY